MQNITPKPTIRRSEQLNDSYCGPAVIEMLLGNIGVFVTQQQIARFGGAKDSIAEHGMRIDQLAQAVRHISHGSVLWVKENATIADIIAIVNTHKYPVGIEWQGLFESPEESSDNFEDTESEYGHYSIITRVDQEKKELIIVDPYKDFVQQDRIFTFDEFLPRWWDTNLVPETGKKTAKLITDRQLLFIVTPEDEDFPLSLSLIPLSTDEELLAEVLQSDPTVQEISYPSFSAQNAQA